MYKFYYKHDKIYSMNNIFDTICAIITPLAYGAVGIIRISGNKSFEIANEIFSRKFTKNSFTYGHIIDENNSKIDEVILLAFENPKSYTGEDVIEIQSHGNPAILNSILNLILKKGARLAQKGEFTKRAFLNGRLDLTQAESVLDIIEAKSEKSAKNALLGLDGYLKKEITSLKEELKTLYSKLIASIDFPEDVKEVSKDEIEEISNKTLINIDNILKNSLSHNFLKDGFNVALIGKPNAGKSSLFNALLNYDRAIVTNIAGTTRDTIKESLNLEGYIINFTDTAGIRDKNKADTVEKIGIENSINEIENSDIVLFLFENDINEIDNSLINLAKNKKTIFLKTKSDINNLPCPSCAIKISSKTGYNLDTLKNEIINYIKTKMPDESIYCVNQRQIGCLNMAKNSIQNVLKTLNEGLLDDDADLFAIDIKQAILAFEEMSGEVFEDDILDKIFSNFCIGK